MPMIKSIVYLSLLARIWSLFAGRPDMTFVVDWALSNNYLSILFAVISYIEWIQCRQCRKHTRLHADTLHNLHKNSTLLTLLVAIAKSRRQFPVNRMDSRRRENDAGRLDGWPGKTKEADVSERFLCRCRVGALTVAVRNTVERVWNGFSELSVKSGLLYYTVL